MKRKSLKTLSSIVVVTPKHPAVAQEEGRGSKDCQVLCDLEVVVSIMLW